MIKSLYVLMAFTVLSLLIIENKTTKSIKIPKIRFEKNSAGVIHIITDDEYRILW